MNENNVVLKINLVLVLKDGEVLFRIIYLLFDFYMWGWMSDVELYVVFVKIGDVMVGVIVC